MNELSSRADDSDAGLTILYPWVQRTREVVFGYLAGVPTEVALARHPAFRGSMLGLLTHVADCYLHWIRHVGEGVGERVDSGEPQGLDEVRRYFARVDEAVAGVLTRPTSELDVPFERRGERLTWRWLVMHPITHEFHHKGQLASLGRILGHPVPEGIDLDLVIPG